jgi:hypothetical protein
MVVPVYGKDLAGSLVRAGRVENRGECFTNAWKAAPMQFGGMAGETEPIARPLRGVWMIHPGVRILDDRKAPAMV